MGTIRAGKRFPLWRHKGTGLWAKKIRGKFYYFGADKAKALERYERDRKYLEEGREPPPVAGGVTVADAVNAFLNERKARVESGELSGGMWGEYFHACEQVVETFGRGRLVDDMRPDDFGKLRAAAAKRLGPAALSKFVTMTRTVFKFAYESELIGTPVRYGSHFEKPPRRVMRLEKATKGPKLIAAADARKLIDAADPQMKAMILLGLTCGFGQTDCSNLQRRHLAVRPGWLDMPRAKTGTPRRCPLWPETAEALAAVADVRPEAKDPADADCVFLTRHRNRWCRYKDGGEDKRGLTLDAATLAFAKLKRRAGVKAPGGFYVLRHTFRTIADEVKDQPAAMAIMGHSDPTMSGYYRELVADDRLLAVVGHVRAWLMADSAKVGAAGR
jgi:integrase